MGSEDLDEGDLEGGDLPVHEDACQIQLHLEADIHVGSVDCRAPPECESAIGDLVQPGALCISQLLVLHRLLKAAGLHGANISALEQHLKNIEGPISH